MYFYVDWKFRSHRRNAEAIAHALFRSHGQNADTIAHALWPLPSAYAFWIFMCFQL